MQKILYKNIEAERARLSLTKVKFAEKLGVTSQTYLKWIRGQSDISASKLRLMAEMCDCSADYLMEVKSNERVNQTTDK